MNSGASSSALRALLYLLLSGDGKNATTISNVNTSVCFSVLFHFDCQNLVSFERIQQTEDDQMTHVLV